MDNRPALLALEAAAIAIYESRARVFSERKYPRSNEDFSQPWTSLPSYTRRRYRTMAILMTDEAEPDFMAGADMVCDPEDGKLPEGYHR